MDFLDDVIEQIQDWFRRLIEALLGSEPQPEAEPIPVPVNDPPRR